MSAALSNRRGTAGFSLLENVVALAILTVGLLGTTRLFGEALRSLRDNQHRQAAIILGEELIDRLIAQRHETLAAEIDCLDVTQRCLDDPLAQTQLAAWHVALSRALPDPRAQLSITGSPTLSASRSIHLHIDWRDSRGAMAAAHFERVVVP